jgi:hypothetical protein
VQGETLRTVIQRGPVPLRKALDIAVQTADGLAAAPTMLAAKVWRLIWPRGTPVNGAESGV